MAYKEPIDPWPLLRAKYKENEYAIFEEVRNDAGFYANRSADGIVMNLWPSRGLEIIGIECKANRSDWLHEIKKPEKAEAVFKYCDRWFLVTSDDKIAKLEEIPASWGWMAVNEKGNRLVTMKEAPKLSPCNLERGFVAAMFKRATGGMIAIHSIKDQIEAARKDERARAEKNIPHELSSLRLSLDHLKKEIENFEKESGIKITGWEGRHSAKALGYLKLHTPESILKSLHSIKNQIAAELKNIGEGIEIFEEEIEQNGK